MKKFFILSIAALAIATPSAHAEVTKTKTVQTPKGTGTKTITADKATGTYSADSSATRASDGATASREYDRTRTENGVSVSGGSTGFNGNSSSYQYDRVRSENGWSTTGSGTGKGGASYDYNAYGQKTETGREASRTLNRNGTQVYNRTDSVSRANGSVQRNTNVTRAGKRRGH